jgi:tryptophan-rich sensory protein
MRRNWQIAGAICVGAVILEAALAGGDPAATLRSMRQPPWSPPFWLWAVIGVCWYAICFVGLGRLLRGDGSTRAPVALLLLLMAANAGWGVLLFRLERFDLAFWSGIPYAAILAALLFTLWAVDRLVFWLFAAYGVYLAYAATWSWWLWRLNA